MKIPRKINPDNLKNSIVQIIISPACAPELFLGYTANALEGLFKFIAGAPNVKESSFTDHGSVLFQPREQGYFLSEEGKFKLHISSAYLSFNQQETYSGWENYFKCIDQTLQALFDNKLISNVIRIGVRYISEFPNVNVFLNSNINLNLSRLPEFNIDKTQFRTEFEDKHYRVIVTLINNLKTGVIDIDVLQAFKDKSNELTVIKEMIQQGHQKQKEIFFGLLEEKFLKTLNPEY